MSSSCVGGRGVTKSQAAPRSSSGVRVASPSATRADRSWATISLYYKDPDGSCIELQVDAMPSSDAIDAGMRTGEFAANPIGVVFDPDEMAARYEAGEPLEALTARPRLPEGVGPFDMLRF